MTGKRKHRHVVHRTAITLGICALAVLAFLPSGAATAARPADRNVVAPDLSTVANVKTYLRSLGVDPRGVVIQRGARNYAGPNCPGAAWNCTTSTRVVQISSAVCSDDLNRVVRRSGSRNPTSRASSCPGQSERRDVRVRRVGTTGTFSDVLIVQGGSQNSAVARLSHAERPREQDVVQRIESNETGGATSSTLMRVKPALSALRSAATATVKQDFHQIICANQIAAGGGSNTASVVQSSNSGAAFYEDGCREHPQNTESLSLGALDGRSRSRSTTSRECMAMVSRALSRAAAGNRRTGRTAALVCSSCPIAAGTRSTGRHRRTCSRRRSSALRPP